MTREWITAQEGHVVYGTYCLGTGVVTTGERGIVYKGTFYRVRVEGDYKNDPTVYLTPVLDREMRDIRRMESSSWGILEVALADCLACRPETLEGKVLDVGMRVPIHVIKKNV